jgi:hypothetical protein
MVSFSVSSAPRVRLPVASGALRGSVVPPRVDRTFAEFTPRVPALLPSNLMGTRVAVAAKSLRRCLGSLVEPYAPSDMITPYQIRAAYKPLPLKPDGFGQATGQGVEGQDTFCPLSVTATRLRRRAVWVRRVEGWLGGDVGCLSKFLRGRWTPDLPTLSGNIELNSLLTYFRHGAKCLGGGTVHGESRDVVSGASSESPQGYLVLELADGSRNVVFTDLFFRLASYAFLRKRDAVLVSSLKSRALEWCKKVGLSEGHTWVAVSSAIHLAWQLSPAEEYASAAVWPGRTPRYWWSGF